MEAFVSDVLMMNIPIYICRTFHQTSEYGTRPRFRWILAQGRSPDTPVEHKNALSLVGIPLKRGASGSRWQT